ncbi:MAG: TlpA family protein disulfide reductase [Actinomycetota bacterium]
MVRGQVEVMLHRAPDDPGRSGPGRFENTPRGLPGAPRALILLACLLALVGCESRSRAQDAGEDPFQRLDLIRAKSPTPAPDFTVPSLTGRPLSLADFRERVVLLNFWATWCPPCREEMPSMERLYQRYKDRGFTILALSIDRNVGAVPGFVERFRLTFPIGLDPESAYQMRALPTTVLIDRVGQVTALAVGARDWDSPAAHAVVETLLR